MPVCQVLKSNKSQSLVPEAIISLYADLRHTYADYHRLIFKCMGMIPEDLYGPSTYMSSDLLYY